MSGVKIELAENGYEVSFDDPEIIAKNRKPNSKSWEDPERCYVFKQPAEVVDFISKLLPKLSKSDDEQTSFAKEFSNMTKKETD